MITSQKLIWTYVRNALREFLALILQYGGMHPPSSRRVSGVSSYWTVISNWVQYDIRNSERGNIPLTNRVRMKQETVAYNFPMDRDSIQNGGKYCLIPFNSEMWNVTSSNINNKISLYNLPKDFRVSQKVKPNAVWNNQEYTKTKLYAKRTDDSI